MKLFRFPVLVFDDIIKQLEPVPLVSLSFCSKKTRERIKKVSFRIKLAWFGNQSIWQRGYYFGVKFPSQQTLFVIFQSTSRAFKKSSENFSVKIRGNSYDCRYQVEGHTIYLDCFAYKKASLFFNYILDLVRAGITEINIDLNILSNTKLFLSEPCFKNVQIIWLNGKAVSSKKVDELYNCFEKPVLQTCAKTFIRSLSRTSNLLQTENLFIYKATHISIRHLLNFTGKYIHLGCSLLQEEDLVAFVKHWLGGNYPNLEGAVITTRIGWVFEPETVLNAFNTKRWNPAERAQNFIYKASYNRDEKNEFPIKDFSNGNDIERSDGLLATMQFEDDDFSFNFFVWHTRFPQ